MYSPFLKIISAILLLQQNNGGSAQDLWYKLVIVIDTWGL